MTTRRQLLRDGAAFALALGMSPAAVWAEARRSATPRDPWLALLCDLVIPDTDTPGASAAGVPSFVRAAIALGLRGTSAAGLGAFRVALDQHSAAHFETLPRERAEAVLSGIDQAILGPRAPTASTAATPDADDALAFWRPLKALIVMGYYSSEIGASQELQYELTPVHFDPDVPLSEQPRAWSSDWTGVKYA